MPRPIWKGQISFGLVSIPVVLNSAERRSELSFRLIDRRDHARIHYRRVNEVNGEEVPWDDIVKAYEYEDNKFVVVTDEDFKRAAPQATQTIDIECFVQAGDIGGPYFDKPYYLTPAKGGDKGYVLLRETLKKLKQVAVARVVIRTREYLAAVMPYDSALLLDLLRFEQEIWPLNEFDFPDKPIVDYRISAPEMQMASMLVKTMSAEWKPEQYRDKYRDALLKWIEKKAAAGGRELPAEPETAEEPAPHVVNIAELLKRSLAQRSGPPARRTKRPARSTTRRKASA